MAKKLNTEIVPCLDFVMIKKLENFLLVFDDSCKKILRKKIVKIAVAGTYKKIHCNSVKQKLFHQSKWLRFFDLNTTHVVLFKSPRDVQPIDHFGRHLNKPEFLRECYQKTISSLYGHFLIHFDPKTSESMRFCYNITTPSPTIFYISCSLAKDKRDRFNK